MLIARLLSHPNMFPKSCLDLCLMVKNAGHDGYAALYNILCHIHPLLMEEEVQMMIPKQSPSESLLTHITAVQCFLRHKMTYGCHYTMKEHVFMVI